MTVTTVPVGNTGLFLEGLEVNGAIRESVVQADPTDPAAFTAVVSTEPAADAYGGVVRVAGAPAVSVAALPGLSVISSIPFYVAQSSAPWDIRGGVSVTNVPTVNVTNVPAVTITSSIPFYVAQSSGPWNVSVTAHPDIRGGVAVTNSPNVNVTNVPAVNITTSIPFYVDQSSAPWTMNGGVAVTNTVAVSPTGTTMVNVVSTVTQRVEITSSVPFYVAQSSAPWSFIETYSTNAGAIGTSVVLLATLNTTVVKAGRGNLYSYQVSNFASTSLFIKLANASSAVIASTAVILWRIGLAPSTTVHGTLDVPINFSTGITMFTTRNPWPQDLTAPLGSTAVVNLEYF